MQSRYVVRGSTVPAGLLIARAAVAAFALSLSACVTSDLQSARLVGPGNFEISPSYTMGSFSGNGETERTTNQFGIQVARGLTPRIDLRMRYEYIDIAPEREKGFSILGFGPKFGLVEDRLAIHLPVGFAFGGDVISSDSWMFRPTVLLTHTINDHAEITTAGKGVIWLNADDTENLIGANLGLGLSSDLDRWVIRPEFGFLRDPGEEGTLWHWSVGFTLFPSAGN